MKAVLLVLVSVLLGVAIAQRDASSSRDSSRGGPPSPPPIKLTYFSARGRGEAIRLLLEDAGLEYEDVRHTSDTWPQAKKEGIADLSLPFGQVPALKHGPVELVQSHAILRFLARRYGYIPPKSIDAEAAADMLAGAVEDVHRKYSAVVYSESWETLLDSYLKDTLPMWLNYFEALLKKRQTPFYLGARVAYPDILVWDMLDSNLRLNPDCLADMPYLQALWARIYSRDQISRYLTSDRRPPFPNGASAKLDNEANPRGYDMEAMFAAVKPLLEQQEAKKEL
jgi:glutathione S-transferase